MAAAIGRIQLQQLSIWNSLRVSNAAFLSANLYGVGLPTVMEGAVHSFHQYTVMIEGLDRNDVALEIVRRGVGVGVYYPTPCHQLPAFSRKEHLEVTELASKRCLSLPVHPALDESDLERIVNVVNAVVNAGA